MVVFYFGADAPYKELQFSGFKRRNTIILKTIGNHQAVDRVYCLHYTSRGKFLKYFFKNFCEESGNIKDVFFSELFVIGKFRSNSLSRLFNRGYFYFLKRKHKRDQIIGWVYWPNGYIDYKLSGFKLDFVFDADHNLVDDPNLDLTSKKFLAKILEDVSRYARLIVSASISMLDWFREKGAVSLLRMRNGIEIDRFQRRDQGCVSAKFTAVYCGILSHWVDYELFAGIIEDNPDIDFVIIGRAFLLDAYSSLDKCPNVIVLGEKSPAEVAKLLPQYDVGLGLYKTSVILDGDSMKVYEYLAAGLPVLCTNYHATLKADFNNLIFIGESRKDFNQILSSLKSGVLKNDCKAVDTFLSSASWESRVSDVLEKLKED